MMRTKPIGWMWGVCLLLGLLAPTLRAGELDELDTSLKLVPADAAFYSSMLRNREQLEILAQSNAWKKVWNLPLVQMGWQQLMKEYQRDGSEFSELKNFYEDEENRELMHVLADALSNEIFLYGGKNFSGLYELLMHANSTMSLAPLKMQLQGNPQGLTPQELQLYGVLKGLSERLDLLNVPDFVIGMKVSDKAKVEKQLARLESLLKAVLQDAPPPIQARLKRQKVGASSILSFSVDGSLVPWNEIPLADLEQKEGEFQPLLRKLQGMQITVSLGVHNGYLLFALGTSTETVEKLGGSEKALSGVAEVQPLAKFADQRLTSIGYVSKELYESLSNPKQFDMLNDLATMMLGQAPIPQAQQQAIATDIKNFVTAIKNAYPEVGASFSFSFLTKRGQESYAYYYAKPRGLDGSKPLTLLNHVGGNPILATVSRTKGGLEGYQELAKWMKIIYGHVDQLVQGNLGENELQMYQQVTQQFMPLVKRFDQVTQTQFFPSLDGQSGLVIDAKWKSKRWHMEAPPTPEAMPLPELGILIGLNDSEKFVKTFTEYRGIINDTLKAIRGFAPPGEMPIQELPAPAVAKQGDASLYFYALPPQLGFDEQVQPTAGVSKDAFVLTLSMAHSKRLLQSQPLNVKEGPLANADRNLCSATYFSFESFVNTLSPWVEFGARMAMQEQFGPDAPKEQTEEMMKQVRTILDVVKCLKTVTSVTYIEDGVLVTHSETVVQDLEE